MKNIGNRTHYDVLNFYEASNKKINILCGIHKKIFTMTANNFLRGFACKNCGYEKNSKILTHTYQEFLYSLEEISRHQKGLYSYPNIEKEYINMTIPINIYCNKHDYLFKMRPADHKMGQGCRICADERKSLKLRKDWKKALEEIRTIHQNTKTEETLYEYPKFKEEYINSKSKITIVCKKCQNIFKQKFWNHRNKDGCVECSFNGISKIEQEWLTSLFIPKDDKHRQIKITCDNGKSFKVDGFIPETKTVLEFLRRLLARES